MSTEEDQETADPRHVLDELKKIFRYDRDELLREFGRASISGKGTPEHVANDREVALRCFLRRYFPIPSRVCKGKVSDSYGRRSSSIDAIVVNPIHPSTMASKERHAFFLAAEGIDYAIELKPQLSSRKEIERGLKQIRSVKVLRRRTHGLLVSGKRLSDSGKDLALQIPCIIFAQEAYKDKRRLIEAIVSYYASRKIPLREQFDIICILDGTIVVNASKKYWTLDVDGLIFRDFGRDVLCYLMFLLLSMPKSTPLMKEDVLSHYISLPQITTWTQYSDLNSQLTSYEEE